MSGNGLYAATVRLISVAMILIGLAIIARTLTLGGGPLSFGLVAGLILLGIGAARLWLVTRKGRQR